MDFMTGYCWAAPLSNTMEQTRFQRPAGALAGWEKFLFL